MRVVALLTLPVILTLFLTAHVAAAQKALDDTLSAAAEMPRLHSLIVSWRGQVLAERYFNGARPARSANIKSASKSIISALVGIAIER